MPALSWPGMSSDIEFPQIGKTELLARLGACSGAPDTRVTVLTPNARLAEALAGEFDRYQSERGLSAWQTADILSWGSYVERLHEDALYAEPIAGVGSVPTLLTPVEEQHLWQEIIEQSPWGGLLLSGAKAASQCRDSWRLAQAWRIAGALVATAAEGDSAQSSGWLAQGEGDGQAEDARAFAQWARTYAARTAREGRIDRARLPDSVALLLREPWVARPALLVVYAFDIVTAQQRSFLAACAGVGMGVVRCQPDRMRGRVVRIAFPSAREELECAARWARQRLEASLSAGSDDGAGRRTPRIGVVVPELEARRKEVVRVFSRTLEPGWNVPGRQSDDGAAGPAVGSAAPLFNVSLGEPLAGWPVVDAALALLELCGGEVEFARASRLLRSPFLAGADAELGARARLDAALRERLPPRVRLHGLIAAIHHATDPEGLRPIPGCPRLATLLGAVHAMARGQLQGSRSPQEWARRYSELLQTAGFPGERSPDSAEFQTLAKWRETLGELARLERVAPRLSHHQAFARLRRLCADTLFQPRMAADGGDAPIQVLGILESGGMSFDHLWVSGLIENAWPLAARPDPFIPHALQKKAGIPQAIAESALELDERITKEWRGAAAEVVFSHPVAEADRELLPSPLIVPIEAQPEASLGLVAQARFRDRIFASGRREGNTREAFSDEYAPAYLASEVRGGTRVLADQAACPFRAFARHRLRAESLGAPVAGLDAAARGQLLHALFARIWGELKSKAGLESTSTDELARIIDVAAAAAVVRLRAANPDIIGERFAALERERLAKLAREWLEVEGSRPDFEVVAREDARTLTAGGLSFRGRIDRMDRIVDDGGHVLIDYKTGRADSASWLGKRPDDAQLPLYAVNAGEGVSAVAFARLRTGGMRFEGIARSDGLLPKVPGVERHRQARAQVADWGQLLSGWRAELDALGRSFAAGDARVDPKAPMKTCANCGLQALCRVHERIDTMGADAEADVPEDVSADEKGGAP